MAFSFAAILLLLCRERVSGQGSSHSSKWAAVPVGVLGVIYLPQSCSLLWGQSQHAAVQSLCAISGCSYTSTSEAAPNRWFIFLSLLYLTETCQLPRGPSSAGRFSCQGKQTLSPGLSTRCCCLSSMEIRLCGQGHGCPLADAMPSGPGAFNKK